MKWPQRSVLHSPSAERHVKAHRCTAHTHYTHTRTTDLSSIWNIYIYIYIYTYKLFIHTHTQSSTTDLPVPSIEYTSIYCIYTVYIHPSIHPPVHLLKFTKWLRSTQSVMKWDQSVHRIWLYFYLSGERGRVGGDTHTHTHTHQKGLGVGGAWGWRH